MYTQKMNLNMSQIRLQRIHHTVMEQCMRHHPNKTVGIDSLLVNARSNRLQLSAIYWAVAHEGVPEIHQRDYYLEGENLRSIDLAPPIDWSHFTYEVTPDGKLRSLRSLR